MTTIPFCMYVVFRCCKYVYRETAQLSEPGSRLWNCRCHGAWNLQRHATVREVSRDAQSTVSEAVPLEKVWQSHGVEDCFSMIMIASLFLFGKWPWQVGKVVRENMPPSRFVQLRRGRNRSVCTLKCIEMLPNVAWFLHCVKFVSSVSWWLAYFGSLGKTRNG